MIRKTMKQAKRRSRSWQGNYRKEVEHVEVVMKETWWFIIIPIYTRHTITYSNL